MAKPNYKQDYYALKAKKEGYSARSVYKLQEIHAKYLNLQKVSRVLDLGAAPGSWTQYLQKQLPKSAEIVALDLVPLSAKLQPNPVVTQIQGDFTDVVLLEVLISLGPFDIIFSDAAPSTSGTKSLDTLKSEQLVEHIMYLATKILAKNGTVVAKIFQGQGITSLVQELKTQYAKVHRFSPKSVKSSSFETYIICC